MKGFVLNKLQILQKQYKKLSVVIFAYSKKETHNNSLYEYGM